ncbi:MAG: hypothetical protein IJW19_01610 [Clostridia bacterium]|nr:hypothetical protein [Clostridia bacterium]
MTNEERTVEKIRAQYEAKEITEVDKLKQLDKEVKRPVKVFSYTFGTAGSLVLGTGMCLAMGVIGSMVGVGVAVGCAGIAMVSSTKAVHDKLLARRKKQYSEKIFEMSDSILNKQD